jgi:hypothetical protein
LSLQRAVRVRGCDASGEPGSLRPPHRAACSPRARGGGRVGRRTDSYTKPGLRSLERRAKRSRLRDCHYPRPCLLVDVGGASPLHGDLSICPSFPSSRRDRGPCDALVPRTASEVADRPCRQVLELGRCVARMRS